MLLKASRSQIIKNDIEHLMVLFYLRFID